MKERRDTMPPTLLEGLMDDAIAAAIVEFGIEDVSYVQLKKNFVKDPGVWEAQAVSISKLIFTGEDADKNTAVEKLIEALEE